MTAPAFRPRPPTRALPDKLAELAARAPAEYAALVALTDAILQRLGPPAPRAPRRRPAAGTAGPAGS